MNNDDYNKIVKGKKGKVVLVALPGYTQQYDLINWGFNFCSFV
jgi:hypothetical protein